MAWLSEVRLETSQEATRPYEHYPNIFDSVLKPVLTGKIGGGSCDDQRIDCKLDALGQFMGCASRPFGSSGLRHCAFALLPRGPEDDNYGVLILRDALVKLDRRWHFEAIDMERDCVYFSNYYAAMINVGVFSIPLQTAHDPESWTFYQNGERALCWDPFYKAFWIVEDCFHTLVLWPTVTTMENRLPVNMPYCCISDVKVIGRNVLMLTVSTTSGKSKWRQKRNKKARQALLDPRFPDDFRFLASTDKYYPYRWGGAVLRTFRYILARVRRWSQQQQHQQRRFRKTPAITVSFRSSTSRISFAPVARGGVHSTQLEELRIPPCRSAVRTPGTDPSIKKTLCVCFIVACKHGRCSSSSSAARFCRLGATSVRGTCLGAIRRLWQRSHHRSCRQDFLSPT